MLDADTTFHQLECARAMVLLQYSEVIVTNSEDVVGLAEVVVVDAGVLHVVAESSDHGGEDFFVGEWENRRSRRSKSGKQSLKETVNRMKNSRHMTKVVIGNCVKIVERDKMDEVFHGVTFDVEVLQKLAIFCPGEYFSGDFNEFFRSEIEE